MLADLAYLAAGGTSTVLMGLTLAPEARGILTGAYFLNERARFSFRSCSYSYSCSYSTIWTQLAAAVVDREV